MRRLLLSASALLALCSGARADLVNNPGIFPSTTLTAGNCLQATGENSVGTTSTPCGSGSGGGTVTGPASSTVGAIAVWADASGTGLANSAITAANIPQLGASQAWGGLNTFNVRPIFASGAVPYDTLNLPAALAPYLLSATAAATYLTPAQAASTYLTPAQAASTFMTPAQVAAIYLSQANAASTYLSQANAAATYATILGVQSAYMRLDGGTFTGAVTFNLAPTYTGAATTFRGTHLTTNNVLRWNLGADGAESGNSSGSDFHLYGYNDAGVFQGAAITVTRSNLTANFLNRPTFGTAVPWDSLNFNPSNFLTTAAAASTYLTIANASSTYLTQSTAMATYLSQANAASIYLTQANAAATYTTPAEVDAALASFLTIANAQSTYATIAGVQSAYMPFTGGAFTGPVAFNVIPTINATIPAASDSTTEIPTTAWVQKAITAKTGGPFMPLSGVGMPYDITIPFTGDIDHPAPKPMPTGYHILYYTFTRKVVIPVGFVGSAMNTLSPATGNVSLGITSTGTAGGIGNLTCAAGASKCAFATVGGPFTFMPGDVLSITTSSNTPDATLAGISGGIEGVLAQ